MEVPPVLKPVHFIFLLFWLFPIPALAETPVLKIPRVSRAPKLEDYIKGTPREAEAVVTDFRQYDPHDGDPITQPTTAFVSYDAKNLYVGWVCKDDPAQIRAHMLKRDNLLTEDRVSISLDTFNDHHRSIFFDVNPYAIQMDGVTIDGKDDFTFDTLWFSEAKLTPDGYAVLIIVPFKSLRFPNTPIQQWGVVFNRMIVRNNEMSCWPYITRRITGWSTQFAHLEGVEQVTHGRNLQFIPYGLFSSTRFLDRIPNEIPAYKTKNNPRAGIDAKLVLKDALTLDMTLNPDFSQVESDEPQVTINQRFEVYFPEKRPFFLENANYFETPQRLFFSRRIADPQFGMRLTGKIGRWGLGALATDDRAPGELVPEGDAMFGERAAAGVFRLMREFSNENRLGLMLTSRDFAGSHNRVYALDTRLKLSPNWTFSGQAIGSDTRQQDGQHLSGPSYAATLSHFGKHFMFSNNYVDRSPDFRADLGFIQRVDLRNWGTSTSYFWRPEKKALVSLGPVIGMMAIWDYKGKLQEWEVEPEFQMELTRMTRFVIEHSTNYELFEGIEFRKSHTRSEFSSELFRWLGVSASISQGTNVNYFPAPGLTPSLATANNSMAGVTLRPIPPLLLDTNYIFSRLANRDDSIPAHTMGNPAIFNNHILRSKINYQFSQALSLRTIFDYNAVLPNHSLVSLERTKKFGADILMTYLLNPWTALYVGYTDLYENLAFDPTLSPYLKRTGFPDTSVGRQFFVKFSYLLRM
jgi:hypothetical protein